MKTLSNKKSALFNLLFHKSYKDGRMGEQFGREIKKLVENSVNYSFLKDKSEDVRQLIASDIIVDVICLFNNLVNKTKAPMINNPYGYFCNSIKNMINTIALQRFSSNATKDVYGCSIVYRGKDRQMKRVKTISYDE